MITQVRKYEICRKLKTHAITFFEDYLISREGKLYYLDQESGTVNDISSNIYKYTKKGVPIYRIIDIKDPSNSLEIRLDKLVLNIFIGELEGKIIHKDYDYKNCSLDNLKYQLNITKIDISDSLWINGKEFKNITQHQNYYVSNDGTLYSNYLNSLMRKNMGLNFYILVKINGKTYKLHRLVYTIWIGEIPKGLTINHKDGNKRNNYYINLETMTSEENVRHAHNTGLSQRVLFTEEQVHTLCQLLEKNFSSKKIIKYFNITDKNKKRRVLDVLHGIMRKEIWKDISSQYNIDNYDINKHRIATKLSTEEVEEICEMLVNKCSIFVIIDKYNICVDTIYKILLGKTWQCVSSGYQLDQSYYDIKITDETIHTICKLIDEKCSDEYIQEKFNISAGEVSTIKYIYINKDLENIMIEENIHTICRMLERGSASKEIIKYFNITNKIEKLKLTNILYNITKRQIYTDISASYNFVSYSDIRLYKKPTFLTIENVNNICKLLEQGNSCRKISELFNVNINTIYQILTHRTWRDISINYNF